MGTATKLKMIISSQFHDQNSLPTSFKMGVISKVCEANYPDICNVLVLIKTKGTTCQDQFILMADHVVTLRHT